MIVKNYHHEGISFCFAGLQKNRAGAIIFKNYPPETRDLRDRRTVIKSLLAMLSALFWALLAKKTTPSRFKPENSKPKTWNLNFFSALSYPAALTLLAFALLLVFSTSGFAEVTNAGILDNALDRYQGASRSWGGAILRAASWLFWTLTLISMVWTFGFMALRRADIGEFFAEFIRFTLFTGFFWWILMNGSDIALAIYDSLRNLAGKATLEDAGFSPSALADRGFALFFKVISQSSVWSPTDSLVSIAMAAIILVILSLVGINMLVLLTSGWFLAYAGVFFLGFGGSRWTSELAVNYYKNVLGVATQLMATTLLIGIGQSFLDDHFNRMSGGVNLKEMGVILVVVMILFGLSSRIPPLVAGIVTGAGLSGFDPLAAVAASGGAALAGGLAGSVAPSLMSQGSSIATGGAALTARAGAALAHEAGAELLDMAQTGFSVAQEAVTAAPGVASSIASSVGSLFGGGSSSSAASNINDASQTVMDVLCNTPFGQASGYCTSFSEAFVKEVGAEVSGMFSAGAGLASSAFSAVGGGIADGLASQTGYRAGNLVGRMGAEISDLAQGVSNTAGHILEKSSNSTSS